MVSTQNPIIQEDPRDTLHYACSIIRLVQSLQISSAMHESTDEQANTGVYWALRCADHAIEFEIARMCK